MMKHQQKGVGSFGEKISVGIAARLAKNGEAQTEWEKKRAGNLHVSEKKTDAKTKCISVRFDQGFGRSETAPHTEGIKKTAQMRGYRRAC